MKSKAIKGMIITVIILLILIVIAIVFWKNYINSLEAIPENKTDVLVPNQTIETLSNQEEYYKIEGMVNQYLTAINDKKYDEILNILDEDYKEQYQITQEQLSNLLKDFTNYQFYANRILYYEETYLNVAYFVYGIVENNVASTAYPIYLTILADYNTQSFSVIPYENSLISSSSEPQEQELDTILDKVDLEKGVESQNGNSIKSQMINDEEIAKKLFNNYRVNAVYNTNYAFNLLDETYRNERFGSLENYQIFVTDNRNKILSTQPIRYQVTKKGNVTEIVIEDSYKNYLIINLKNDMTYTIQLDNYTIPSEEFKSKYLSADQKTKVATDLDMFFNMINTKDYSHAYEKLDDGFKQNYFPTQSDFDNYMKQHFFDYNYIGVNNSRNEGDVFIYELGIKDGVSSGAQEMAKTFLVKLGEGLDFDISFNVE